MKARWIVTVLLLALTTLSAHAEAPGGAPSADQCTVAKPVARYVGLGYQHVVEVTNNCAKPVRCEVWTDVDPTPRHNLSVKPGETGSVIVRQGSPAREFKAEKACKY